MTSNSALPAGRFPLALASFVLVAAVSAHGADVLYYFVAKANAFNQNTSAGPVPKGNPARFLAQVVLSQTNSVTNATVQFLPSGSVTNLTLGVGGKAGVMDTFSYPAKFASQNALDAAYPNGNYQMVIRTVHDGTKSSTLALNGNVYPANGPFVTNPIDTNYTAVVVTNPAAPFMLTWAPFAGGTSSDFIQVTLGNSAASIQTPGPGQPNALNGTATSWLVPSNALPSGALSFGSLVFAKIVQMNSTSYPGVPGFAAYYTETDFGVVALGQDVAEYNLAKHQFFSQTNSGAPVLGSPALGTGPPFRFVAQVFATDSNIVSTAQVQPPAPGVLDALAPDPTDTVFANIQRFPTQAALDAAFLSGNYTVQITAAHDGNQILTLNMPSDSFPVAPHLSNWAAAQNINPAADFKLAWDPFSGATALDSIVVALSDTNGNPLVLDVLPGAATNDDFPVGTFKSGQSYSVQLQFRHIVSQNTTSYPGVTGDVRFVSRTLANLTASGGGPVAPKLAVVSTNGANSFQLQLTGQPGRLYAIDTSTNLQTGSWIPLVTNTAVGGQMTFTDSQSSSFPKRFYRGRAAN